MIARYLAEKGARISVRSSLLRFFRYNTIDELIRTYTLTTFTDSRDAYG
jgi:hypothetical protein